MKKIFLLLIVCTFICSCTKSKKELIQKKWKCDKYVDRFELSDYLAGKIFCNDCKITCRRGFLVNDITNPDEAPSSWIFTKDDSLIFIRRDLLDNKVYKKTWNIEGDSLILRLTREVCSQNECLDFKIGFKIETLDEKKLVLSHTIVDRTVRIYFTNQEDSDKESGGKMEQDNSDKFLGNWYPVKIRGGRAFNLSYDGTNYILKNLEINQEAVLEKKNKLLLLSLDGTTTFRYDESTNHLFCSAPAETIEYYKK